MTRLFLIRHGITVWNKQGRYCGCKDVSLSSQGKIQVAKLRMSLGSLRFDKIYCSDRKRALQSRSILFGRHKFTKMKGLREINFGVLEGLKHDEIMKKYSEVYKNWLTNPYKARIPRAEPMQIFKKRVVGTIKKIFKINSGKTIAAVCHGGVIGAFVSNILKKDREFWRYVPASSSITVVEYKDKKFKLSKFYHKKYLSSK
ncbi:MAG: histidine phosphatase family protein [Candidatus Omnitrophica bacterium]|nr:histidine phosphatase family protein [Candidatus Omnitrophota bacterium]